MIVGVRHAQVWNPEGVVYARLPGFHLSEEGRAATRRLSAALARAPVAAVHASTMERAVETAEIMAEPHGLPVVQDDRLAEWSFWVGWQGLRWDRIRECHGELLDAYAADPESPLLQEPLRTAAGRVLEWADDADRAHPDGLVLGVTHEAPLTAAWLLGSGAGLAGFHHARLPHLGTVRLRPGPAEPVDLVQWARSC